MSNETKLARGFLAECSIKENPMTASMHISCLCDVVENQQKRIDELERDIIKEIENRDHWEEEATKLAELVGKLLGIDVGEHTSANCPVKNAIEHINEVLS